VGGVVRFMRSLLLFTTAFELAGAALLFVRFREVFPPGEAAFQALFHSVSAFNNAGFILLPDNLMRYATDPLVSLVIAGLLIVPAGGATEGRVWHALEPLALACERDVTANCGAVPDPFVGGLRFKAQ